MNAPRRLLPLSALVLVLGATGAAATACGDDPHAGPGALPDAAAPADGPVGPGDPDAASGADGDAPDGPAPDGGPDGGPSADKVRFVLLGDFGFDDANEAAVAGLVDSWAPDFVVTLGDNSYPESTAATIDETIGKYYAKYIHPYRGKYGPGAATPRFFACLGNHDWQSGSIQAHLDYFDLPGNERYWQLVKGPVRFFCLDSDAKEPDGVTAGSAQGQWLERELGAARDPYRLVVLHHPPHSSGQHGSQPTMQWPFREWGASAVYAGHDHDYERFDFGLGTIPYVVQGLGGADLRPMNTSRAGSVVAYSEKHGATLVEADAYYARFAALTIGKDRIDEHVVASTAEAGRATDVLLPPGGPVRYLDDAAPAAGWTTQAFDAAAWKSGTAPLGFGQPGTTTTLARGLSHYVRAAFTVVDPNAYDHAVVWVQRDDGAAVYVNGEELGRSNLPQGALTPTTAALETVGFAAETAFVPFVVPRRLLRSGTNVVAVELHQVNAQTSDAFVNLRVEGKR